MGIYCLFGLMIQHMILSKFLHILLEVWHVLQQVFASLGYFDCLVRASVGCQQMFGAAGQRFWR